MTLRIATWNINSVRIRGPLMEQFIKEAAPDILCLQETKVPDELFPSEAIRAMGFPYAYFSGQKSYNGVAILSKIPLKDVACYRMLDNDDRRHMRAILPDGTEIHNFYVPAGGDIPVALLNPKFKDKLAFVDSMTEWSGEIAGPKAKFIILGDFNIAPLENDVWSHKQLMKVVSHTPIEVEKLGRLRASANWVDVLRHFVPANEKLYSWWSYRNHDWEKSDRGRRLDHIWVTPALRQTLKAAHIHRPARGWENPSDHVPVVVDFEGIGA